MRVRWLNQGGFLFEFPGCRLVVDAYLSDAVEQREGLTRLADPPLTLEELNPDFWVCTHDHLDHFDPPTIKTLVQNHEPCRFLGPASVQRHLKEMGASPEQVVSLSAGGQVRCNGFLVSAVPAIHSDPDAIGLVLSGEGLRIYVSGDTEFPTHPDRFANQLGKIDLMFICINGKWGNMNALEAVAMVERVRPRMAIPMHYGLFAENTVLPDGFLRGCAELGVGATALQSGLAYEIEDLMA